METHYYSETIYHDDVDFMRAVYLLDGLGNRYEEFGFTPTCMGTLVDAWNELTDWGQHWPAPGMSDFLEADTATEAFDLVGGLLDRLLSKSRDLETTLRVTRSRDLLAQARELAQA